MIILLRHLMLPAIEAMNGQYLCNRQITVSYAYKIYTKGSVTWYSNREFFGYKQSNCPKEQAAHFICQWTSNTSECSSVNGTVPPRPFANGSEASSPIPALRPPQGAAVHPMPMGGLLSWHAAIGSTNPTTCHASTTSALQAPSPKYATALLLHSKASTTTDRDGSPTTYVESTTATALSATAAWLAPMPQCSIPPPPLLHNPNKLPLPTSSST